MNPIKIEMLAHQLMDKHGLADWRFKINGRLKSTLGRCCYTSKLIELSKEYVLNDSIENITDTILHEIAHALVPSGKHCERWKAMCRKIGARPEQYKSTSELVKPYKYQLAVVHRGVYGSKSVERLRKFSNRKTNLYGKALRGQPETFNKLEWVEA